MKKNLLTVLSVLLFASAFSQEASVREEFIPFTTYSFDDPDPVASPGRIFPYFRFDNFSYSPEVVKHKMIVLENEWIKVWVAPDIGGKVWGALDKKTNKYFIYYNNVVKFRDIAMRGPWTSGGIEHNFGVIGHAPTVSTPVDYAFRKNDDGSVSCFVGAIDLPSRTEWRVELRVPKDKAWFETISYWYNPTDLRSSLYHWENASADGTNDLRFYYPGKAEIGHGGELSDWPVLKDGRDISLYGNNNFESSKSYHVLGEYTDWFAGIYEQSNFGFGHWTRQPVKPGKKIWIWSLARDGAIWIDLLTDTEKGNTQYIELQTGLLYNQAGDGSTMSPFKHIYFEPGAVENFTELWFPISNLTEINSISREGILNVKKTGSNHTIQFQALGFVKDNLQITDTEGKIVSEFKLDLKPQEIFTKSVDLTGNNIKFRLEKGELMYDMSDKEANFLDRPLTIQENFDWESVYGLYTRGVEKLRQRQYSEAVIFLKRCLEKDPWYMPALTSLAETDIHFMRFDEAEKKLLEVIRFDAYDPDANFLYGVLLMKKGEFNKARDAFGVTLRSPGYKSVSRNKLALIALNENRLEEAWEYAKDAVLYNGMDKNNYRTAAVVARRRGNNKKHEELLYKMLKEDPLNHFALFEKYYIKKDSEAKDNLFSRITGEFKYETLIEMALWYYNAGLLDEALSVMEICPENPVADYLTAYLMSLKNDNEKSQFYLRRALGADDKLVFPYREEYARILEWADKQQNHWKTKYYSAIFYWNRERNDMAKKYFMECGDQPDSYSFYLSRGRFINETGGNAEADYLKAMNLNADNWRPYHILYNYYVSNNKYDRALDITGKAVSMFKERYVIGFDHAMSLLYNGRYDESVRVLERIKILPHEGAGYGRMAWKNANLLNALNYYSKRNYRKALIYAGNAYKWPENLGVGRPYTVDERAEDFINAIILERSGNKKRSAELFEKIAQYNDGKPTGNRSINYLSLAALSKLGQKEKADIYFRQWMEVPGNDKIKEWAGLMMSGRKTEAAGIIKSVGDQGEGTPWNPRDTDADFRLINEIAQKVW